MRKSMRLTDHSVAGWADLVRGGPHAAAVCATDPAAPEAARVVPSGAKVKRLGKSGGVIAGYSAKRRKRHCGIGAVRLADLTKLVKARFHGPVDTDDAVLLSEVAAAHGDAVSVQRWIKRWTPGIDPASVLDDERVTSRRWTAKALGKALGLTWEERRLLSIRTIRAADITPAEARKRARAIDLANECQNDAKRRRDAGIKPRVKGDTAAAEAAARNVSRSTIMRKRRAAKRCDTPKPEHTSLVTPCRFSGVSPETRLPMPHPDIGWQAAALRAARNAIPVHQLDVKTISFARIVAANAAAHRLAAVLRRNMS